MATSVPVPMAMPRSAWASAGASLMPSPTIATTWPCACSAVTAVGLLRRAAPRPARGRCRPRGRWRVGGRARCRRSASTPRRPSACSCATASADSGFSGVGDGDQAGGRRRRPRRTSACRAGPGRLAARRVERGDVDRRGGHQARGCRPGRRRPSTVASMPCPGTAWKRCAGGRSRPRSRARGDDRLAERVLGADLGGRDQPRAVSVAAAIRRASTTSGDGGLAAGQRAGLVEHDRRSMRRRLLERLAAADQDAVLGGLAGADHDRGRRRQAERARAGDDQHGDRGADAPGAAPASGPSSEPADERQRGQDQDGRDEHVGDPVGQALHRRLGALRVLDQAHDLRERGVLADRAWRGRRTSRSR